MSLLADIALVAVGAGAAFALQVVLLMFLNRPDRAIQIALLAWLPLVTLASYGLFEVIDWRMAQTHSQNVGEAIVVFGIWAIAAGPGLLIGLLLVRFHQWLARIGPYDPDAPI